ncbi:MAG: hypothetical protein PW792_16100 [Acidobacteriaceae bacterium]|nr:hypothetical protein [Acidobacteriaceae bacterium]
MKLLRTSLVAACLFAATVAVCSAQEPAWETRLGAKHEALVRDNGPGTDAELRTRLLAMRDEDQNARFQNIKDVAARKPADAHELAELDAKLTEELQEIVDEKGWPTVHLVGYDASQAASLILIHSPDHAWQRSMLPQLEALVQNNQIDGSQIALVVDKELVAAGKPQRYGSQFKFVDGQAMMIAVEDPAHLDERREKAMLPPLDAYKKMLGDMYHVTVSNIILAPTAPAGAKAEAAPVKKQPAKATAKKKKKKS